MVMQQVSDNILMGTPHASPSHAYDLKILTVEASRSHTELNEILSNYNLVSDYASGLVEVLQILRKQKYDIVFFSLQRSNINVYEIASFLKNSTSEMRPFMLGMGSNPQMGERDRCLLAGMNDYMELPLKSDKVQMLLDKVQSLKTKNTPEIVLFNQEKVVRLKNSPNKEQVRKLVISFENNTEAEVQSIHSSYRMFDLKTLEKQLHHLRGTCLSLGATAMADLLWLMEQSLIKNKDTDLNKEMGQLNILADISVKKLKTIFY